MLIVLPFCERDHERAIQLLEWIGELGGARNHPCALIAARACPSELRNKVKLAADGKFSNVDMFMPGKEDERGWPWSCNTLFRAACIYAEAGRSHWFWMEPDAVPLQSDWADKLDAEYIRGGKAFMGRLWDRPNRHLTGTAVYPAVVRKFNPVMLNPGDLAFDVAAPEQTLRNAHFTTLIQHVWGDIKTNTAPTFPDAQSLSMIEKDAVIFHRCKDGTLIDRIREMRVVIESKKADDSKDLVKRITDYITKLCNRSQSVPMQEQDIPCFVQLGRIGDILNILPVIYFFSSVSHRRKIPIITHKTMQRVLDRCRYARPIVWNSDMNDKEGAEAMAKKVARQTICCQLFGFGGVKRGPTEHYNMDQWYNAGMLERWGTLPLELDGRDWKAEQAWFDRNRKTDLPLICYNLNGGSSPFSDHAKLAKALHAKFDGKAELWDLDKMKVECYTDQLAALDRCDVCLTIDTATLHLVQGSHCPYVALLSDRDGDGWKATALRREPARQLPYGDWLKCQADILSTISTAIHVPKWNGRLWHVVPRRLPGNDRVERARANWELLYSRGVLSESHVWKTSRTADKIIGDKRMLPFLKDVLRSLPSFSDGDAIVFTNDDIHLTAEACRQMRLKFRYVDVITGARVDCKEKVATECKDTVYAGERHLGRDLAAFKVSWLKANMDLIPDFILGASEWDIVLAALARKLCGVPTTAANIGMVFPECELSAGTIAHEAHQAYWNSPGNETAPSQLHNRAIAEDWFRTNSPMTHFGWFNRV